MLEELQTLALVGLLVSTYYLTIGCRKIGDSLPTESGQITDKVGDATEVLDDIANLLNEGLQSLTGGGSHQTPPDLMTTVISSLMSGMTSKAEHGPLKEIRPIRQDDSPPTLETENQLD
ncbi:hypothetical protein N9O16_04930 [Candidatus Poseidoniaceae archaeon]|nr:hypothetical protein [Candidatus Poseidoniaceae archaeon]